MAAAQAQGALPSDFQRLDELLADQRDQPLPDEIHALSEHLAAQWYLTSICKPVVVDVVAEFAVQELVAIDGDSMLLYCFEQAKSLLLDTEATGFVPLTIVYLVEEFLRKLRNARLRYEIVWFTDRRIVSVGRSSSPVQKASKAFARSAIQKHLQNCQTEQHHFQSISNKEWRQWLLLKRPYAIMTTDGGLQFERSTDSVQIADHYALAQHLSGGIESDTLAEGVSVLLMSKSMFQDYKVLCFLIESRPLVRHAIKLQKKGYAGLAAKVQPEPEVPLASQQSLPASLQTLELTPAEILAFQCAQNPQASSTHRVALILQAVLIGALSLKTRAVKVTGSEIDRSASDFLAGAFEAASAWLASEKISPAHIVDLIDPRLFACCLTHRDIISGQSSSSILDRFNGIAKALNLEELQRTEHSTEGPGNGAEKRVQRHLLPYNAPAKLSVPDLPTSADAAVINEPSLFLPRITADAERSQVQSSSFLSQYKRSGKDSKIPRDAHGRIINKLQAKRFKADQRYSTWVAAYAQSLLGSAGLTRQVITEGKPPVVVQQAPASAVEEVNEDKGKKGKGGAKAAGGKKTLSKKEQIIAQNQARKSDKASAQTERKLTYLLEELDVGPAVSKFEAADRQMLAERRAQMTSLSPYIASSGASEATRDLRLLRVRLAVEAWVCACTIGIQKEVFDIAVTTFSEIGLILKAIPAEGFNDHERALLCSCGQALRVLGLQGVYGPAHKGLEAVWAEVEEKKGKPKKGEFPFDINWPRASKKYVVGDPLEFQLEHCGDVMERQLDSRSDRRVPTFKPDGWQVKLLDGVDEGNTNMLVVAPTSAGKTFIAYYCMEKALRESSDAVVVYVAPSKALVNQIAAELEARYTKNYSGSERTIWAISTGEFDVHNPLKCQVLVAAPEAFYKMCLQSDVAGAWLPRVKYVVMDEIHSLTDLELGSTWQQLLALVPCPIVALSATIGNVDEFGEWLSKVRARHGQKTTVIQHGTRYSDLKKHVFLPSSEQEGFAGLTKPLPATFFRPLHPFTALRPAGSSIPSDLELTPGEQLQLVRAMQKVASAEKGFPLDEKLDPEEFFADVVGPIKRAHTIQYQQSLRRAVQTWMETAESRQAGSPFIKLMDTLEGGLSKGMEDLNQKVPGTMAHLDFQRDNLLNLLGGMHQQSLLPALCFNFSRDDVEVLGQHLIEQLTSREGHYKAHNKTWKAKLEEWEKWVNDEPARRKAEEKKMKAIKGREEADAIKKDARATDSGWQASFNPEAPLADFTFANEKCGYALEDIVPEVERLKVPMPWMRDGLIRGIGIHHSGLPLNYRQVVERWFRKGWLRVVICTASLALGINMPARTSVFVGDHAELNALQFRQAAGRAGRRGLDLAGNVLFYGLPLPKIQRLLTSRLPALDCDYPSSATLNLRLHGLLVDNSSKKLGTRMVESVVGLDKPSVRETELPLNQQFRASVEFLRRFGLLSSDGTPLALSGVATNLSSSEPSNLAFIELLRSGCLYKIAASASQNRIAAVEQMVTVLSHLFAARPVNPTSRVEKAEDALPPLPEEARAVLTKLDSQAKQAYLDFVAASSEAGLVADDTEETLPVSSTKAGSAKGSEIQELFQEAQLKVLAQSSFAAAGGVTEDVSGNSLSQAMSALRSGLRVTPSVIPSFDSLLNGEPKNSYILDFFRDGNEYALVSKNGFSGSASAWLSLRDFWTVLLSLRSCLELVIKSAARSRRSLAKRNGTAGGAGEDVATSSEADSWDADDASNAGDVGGGGGGGGDYQFDDDDVGNDPADNADMHTDSGIAGSQMSGLGGAKAAPTLHRAGEVRTKSGKVVEAVAPPMDAPRDKNDKLWAVYEMLVDIQVTYHSRFFRTFA